MKANGETRLDPSMEKKASLHNATVVTTTTVDMDGIPKHQHNTPPQYLRYMQQGLKIPNNQLQQQHLRQSPMIHQHVHQPYMNKPPGNLYNTANIHTNPLHVHYNNQYIYQQNKLKQHQQQLSPLSPIYQTHQHATTYQHNPNLTPQPWVPPHSSVNAVYQSQNQIKSEPGTPTTTTSSTNTMNTNMNLNTSNTTPVHNKHRELERRKSGGHTQLRSPSAKRPSDAPVTLQGWLHKQGSDGLMLWKKRWFVLSEYVLFYYKGPEEEKLLGSVLLPSYRVSICGPEDRANRKFAFKCEHTNMRTYVLAADTQELMMQWARALNLASLLQSNIESDSSLNTPSSYNPLNETIESNYSHNPIIQQQPQPQSQAQIMRLPLHAHSSSNTTEFSNPSQDLNHHMNLSQYNQPLYANAPPKPRRLNDTGYSSPSPDTLERYNEPKYVTLQPPAYLRNMSKSNSVYSQDSVYNQEYQGQQQQHQQLQQYIAQNTERRTPDTYGRSKTHMLNGTAQNGRHPSDYEDIYAEQYMYKRPLSPLAYNKSISITTPMTPIQRSYTPMSITRSDSREVRKSPNSVPRPHSADFLEYEATHRLNQAMSVNPQPARPKSSLDINRNGDNYFYSEERYAEKMRKSAQYLSKLPGKYSTPPRRSHEIQADNTFPLMRSNTQPLNYATTPVEYSSTRRESLPLQPTRCRSVLSERSISKELDGELYGSQYKELPNAQTDHLYGHRYDHLREYDPFTRSASARLANIEQRLQGDGRASMNKEGERKREESMKRLLEWKQRMLQSPLNRKVNQNVNKTYSKPEYYKRASSYARHVDGRSAMGQYNSYSSDDEASGSLSMGMHNMAAMQRDYQQHQSRSTSNLHRSYDSDYTIWQDYYLSPAPSQQNIEAENRKTPWNAKVKLSAGDLLGRTHEELVLLLIQLRRQSTNICHAIEAGYNEIDSIQAQLHLMDAAKRMESLQKLEAIKQHLLDLEKQYEKGKPMVNLVDNMVKLGSLYKFPSSDRSSSYTTRDRIEFNQQMQEKKLLDDERRDWNRINSSHLQLQEKVQQLYELDQLIQEGSGTLQGLQQDKEDIERALGGIRSRLMQGYNDPEIIEKAKKQQSILENELSRVHLMLAQNSKQLEETVAGNARLEQELLVLRQKLQASKQNQNRSSPQFSNPGDSLTCGIANIGNSNGLMESDLQKVQQKVGDLQKQRQELSLQVRQLTDRSSIPMKSFDGKKRIHSGWRETDLDTMYIRDHGESNWESNSSIPSSMSPLYIRTDLKGQGPVQNQIQSNPQEDIYGGTTPIDDYSTSHQFTMPLPQEKPEIKTVRIVKRESERRHRDRDRDKVTPSGPSGPNKYDALIEDDFYVTSSPTRPTTLSVQKATSSTNLTYPEDNLSRTSSTPSISQFEKDASPVLSPVFKSEAARQIITEIGQETPKNKNRRAVPIEKRRHYTAPHNNLIRKSFNQLPTTDDDTFNKAVLETRRARDDLDMERALRQRIDAPDVVRSTLSSKELKYTENTIDNLFGAPNKIFIPERYIPEQTPQLSAEEEEHRLRKVESIKKMLSDTTILSTSTANLANGDEGETSTAAASTTTKATTKMIEEKKQREHLLQLNQILAKQVMEMSKIVAVKALSKLPLESQAGNSDDEDSSPISPLPLYQQRDNFYS